MDRPAFVVGPSRNKILQAAWAGHKAAQKAEGKAKPVEAPAGSIPKENVASSTAYERAARKHLDCQHCGKKPLFPQFCHRDEGKGGAIKTDVREGWVGCGPNLATSQPGCHWLIGTSGTFTKAERRAMDLKYGASTRALMRAKGLWPKSLAPWPDKKEGTKK